MTWNADGSCTCDRCGQDVGNGGIFSAMVMVDLVTNEEGETSSATLHACRDTVDAEGTVSRKGCVRNIRATLARPRGENK